MRLPLPFLPRAVAPAYVCLSTWVAMHLVTTANAAAWRGQETAPRPPEHAAHPALIASTLASGFRCTRGLIRGRSHSFRINASHRTSWAGLEEGEPTQKSQD